MVPIIVGSLTIGLTQPPNILVSADGKLTGVISSDGVLLVSSPRSQGFVRDQWLRRTGAQSWRAYPQPGEGLVAGMRCDLAGCVFQDGGRTVAFVHEARAFPDDCRSADILVVRFTAPRGCTGPSVIVDRRALIRNGSHTITWPKGGTNSDVVVKNSGSVDGRRLWLKRPDSQ